MSLLQEKRERFMKEVKNYDEMMKDYMVKEFGNSIFDLDGEQFEMFKSMMHFVKTSIELTEAFSMELEKQTRLLEEIESKLRD